MSGVKIMNTKKSFFIFVLFFVSVQFALEHFACADEVYLKNKDKLTGKIVAETKSEISVETQAMGRISVKREFVDRIVKERPGEAAKDEKAEEANWHGEVAAGYDTMRGNTETEQLYLKALLNRNRKHIDEWTFKTDLYYSSANKKMDAQKWYLMGRYAYSFGPKKLWYNFYRMEGDHDRFANVDYRLLPAGGIGYWFIDLSKTKLLAEAALGVEYTDYRDEKTNTTALTAIPRLYFEYILFENIKFSEDFYIYPELTNNGEYRIHSETALAFSLNGKLAIRLSLIDDYNANPPLNTKKNDLNFISSLVYSY